MGDIVVIPTTTILTIQSTSLTEYTYYNGSLLPDLLQVIIENYVGILNGIPFIENELVVVYSNLDGFSVQINSNGELIITSADSFNYSINANGELIYTPS